MRPATQLRAVAAVGLAVLVLTLWPPPEPAPEPPAEPPPRPAPRPRVEITRPAPELIHEPPARADGLDRVAPCGVTGRRLAPMPLLNDYVYARREALGDALRIEGEAALGAQFRDALGAPAPTEAAVPTGEGEAAHFATLITLAEGARQAERNEAAIAYATDAVAARPDDPLGYVLVSLAARNAGDDALADAALAHAFRRAPGERTIAQNTLLDLRLTSDVMGALAAADAMVDIAPEPEWIESRARLAARAHVFADGLRRSRSGATVIGTAALGVAVADHLLDLAVAALEHARSTLGRAPRRELVIYVYPDAATVQDTTCRVPGDLLFVRADLDGPDADAGLSDRLNTIAMTRAMLFAPGWLGEAIVARDTDGPEDRESYAELARSHHWIEPAQLELTSTVPPLENLSRAEARAIVEWLVARRGEEVLHQLALADGSLRRDPAARISEIAGAPLDERTLLAFMAARAE